MSLYCKGKGCMRKVECLRYRYGKKYSDSKPIEGLWWINERVCTMKDHEDGVFD